MIRRRTLAPLALAAALLAAPGCAADDGAGLLRFDEPAQIRKLQRQTIDGQRLGGLSGLEWAPDRGALIAVSDRGDVFAVPLDPARPVTALGRLKAPHGLADAEAIRRMPDGGWRVAFEVGDTILGYGPGVDGLLEAPTSERDLTRLGRIPYNGGIETMALLDFSRLLIIAEQGPKTARRAWVLDGEAARPRSYATSDGFDPTDAVALANGDVLVLERRFNGVVPPFFSARLALVPRAALDGEAGAIEVERRIDLAGLLPSENWEGIAVVQAAGETTLWLVSDDNFRWPQNTLLARIPLAALGLSGNAD